MANTLFHQELNRLNMGELLNPEQDYQLEFAVGLTYSLDFEALLGIPVALGMFEDLDSSHMSNPFFLLEAIRKSSDKMAIFCNLGSIKVPKDYLNVFTLLEQSIFEIGIKDGNFHPKVWFIKYINKQNETLFKVIILSRNLTFDRSLDVAVELSGHIGKTINEDNRPLSDLLVYVSKQANSKKAKMIISLAEEIMKIEAFEGLDQIEKITFHHFGVSNSSTNAESLFSDANSLIVMSPFLTGPIIEKITARPKDKILITRKSSVTKEIFDNFNEVYIVADKMLDDDVMEENAIENSPKRDIHAKVFFEGSNQGNYLYCGSLNASYNAFHKNVEFLVGFKFKPNSKGYTTIKNDLIASEPCPFERLDDYDSSLTPESEDIKTSLTDILLVLSETTAVVSINGEDYQIKIKCKPGVNPVMIRPITKPYGFVKLDNDTLLDKLNLLELTEFYVIRCDKESAIVKISTKGIPTYERDNLIFRSFISNKGGFLAFVSFMLADNYSEVSFEQREYIDGLLSKKQKVKQIPSALYERLLKASFNDPKKIYEIEEVMNRLESTVVTDDFKAMLAIFKSVSKKAKTR